MGVLRGPHWAERPQIVWHHLHVLGSPPPQGPSPSLCGHHQLPLEEGACEGCSPRPSVGWWRPARDLRGLRSTAASPRPGRDVSDGRVGQSQPAREPRCSNERRTGCRKRKSKEEKKVNCKPKNQDEQEIPFRLREIMRSQQEMKNPLSNKKRKKEAQVAFRRTLEKEAKGAEPDIVVPKFKQRKGESDGAYIQRMEQEAQYVMFLSKNQASRQPEVQVAPKKEKSERKKSFQKRRLDKVRQKKEAKAADRLEQELLQDTVKFGEVVLQPPELTAKPRRSEPRDQPGQKSLMLRKLLSPSSVSQPLTTSMARQRILQEERERAVRAYRALKKQQQQGTLPPPRPGCTHSTLEAQS